MEDASLGADILMLYREIWEGYKLASSQAERGNKRGEVIFLQARVASVASALYSYGNG